jgi:putative PIN family toxin of toxin-antitoxin system
MSDKLRIVIDTNVLVSALWSESGIPAEILKQIPENVLPCLNEAILEEYKEVLNRPKFNFSTIKKELLLEKLKEFSEIVVPEKSRVAIIDESDRIFYDTAIAAKAFLITGNLKHYPTEPHIIAPKEFLKELCNDS